MAATSLRTMGGGAGTISFMLCMSHETGRNFSAKTDGRKPNVKLQASSSKLQGSAKLQMGASGQYHDPLATDAPSPKLQAPNAQSFRAASRCWSLVLGASLEVES